MPSTASPHALAARDEKRREALALGIDEAFVSDLVENFYGRVQRDPELGPIFDARVGDWPTHLERMKRFWRSVLFSSGEFLGNPMIKHAMIPGLDRALFDRWLLLFGETLDELGDADAREHVHSRARMIAGSLLNGIGMYRARAETVG
ncbi:MAG TPA: group III truncated hemoglobin [Sphingomicrobium sp.]|jgi:hemoglobin|nr:group III truncated hemoglobin [Sphingomicrobium sp.]